MPGVSFCGRCICDTCANSVESNYHYRTLGEMDEPCFTCDECRHYDGDWHKRSQWREQCERFKLQQKRRFRVLKGGRKK